MQAQEPGCLSRGIPFQAQFHEPAIGFVQFPDQVLHGFTQDDSACGAGAWAARVGFGLRLGLRLTLRFLEPLMAFPVAPVLNDLVLDESSCQRSQLFGCMESKLFAVEAVDESAIGGLDKVGRIKKDRRARLSKAWAVRNNSFS